MRTVPIKPITGYMDVRSNPQDVPTGGYRHVLNFGVEQKNKLCRIPGWERLLDRTDYNNHDLHDQLNSITGVSDRRPITFLFEAKSVTKSKMLLAGTDRVIYGLALGTGNWRVLSDELGVDGQTRWYATQNLDTVILTNDYDPVVYWTFDAPPDADDQQSVAQVQDLIDLKITRVGVVVTWHGCTFYMNVVKDGAALTHKIYWSDYEKPLSINPSEDSIASNFEVDSQESILWAEPMGNVLLIYTTRAIWEISESGDPNRVFELARRYTPTKTGEACLAYKNALVSVGDEHIYLGKDGIYSYSLFVPKPKLVDWIHRASSAIYDDIEEARCDWHIGVYNPARREVMFSWVRAGQTYPDRTLVINWEFPFSGIMDHGWTAFGQFQPNEPVTTLAQWLLDNCICDSEEFDEVFGELIKEGGQCSGGEEVTCDSQPDSFFTTVTQELEEGVVMEDWNETDNTENSLCSQIADTTISSLCVSESKRDQCNAGALFVMASAQDFCLKEMTLGYSRRVCTVFTGCGTYGRVGYKSILRTGPMAFKDISSEKIVHRFAAEAIAIEAAIPGQCSFRVGVSSMANDPNDPDCGIVWYSEDPKTLDCIARSAASHAAAATRPDDQLEWPTYAVGKYLYFELTIENPASTPIDVGAAVCFSSFEVDLDGARVEKYS